MDSSTTCFEAIICSNMQSVQKENLSRRLNSWIAIETISEANVWRTNKLIPIQRDLLSFYVSIFFITCQTHQ